jgi:hypothetical protein
MGLVASCAIHAPGRHGGGGDDTVGEVACSFFGGGAAQTQVT